MITVYVDKATMAIKQVFPVPADLSDWYVAPFEGEIAQLHNYTYDPEQNEFLYTPVEGVAGILRRIPVLSFRRRLTSAEKIQIYELAKTNVVIQIMLDELNLVETGVLLDDPEVVAGLELLVTEGILTAERVSDILRDGEPYEY